MKIILTICSLVLLFSACKENTTSTPQPTGLAYPLFIDIQSGFSDEKVIVRIDGKEVINKNFNTNWSIGFAGSEQVKLTEGSHSLRVELPARNAWLEQSYTQIADSLWLGVNYRTDIQQIDVRVSERHFDYD